LADAAPASGADDFVDAADEAVGFYDNPVYAYAWSVIVSRSSRHAGPVVVTGEAGIGKSLLMRRVFRALGDDVFPLWSSSEGGDLKEPLERIEGQLGLSSTEPEAGPSLEARLTRCRERLLDRRGGGDWIVLFVDDAGDLPDAKLAELLQLALPEPHGDPVLGLVLAGRPSLERRLEKPELHVLVDDNLHVCRLRPLRTSEVGVYIQKRCKVAGSWRNQLLSPQAAARIGTYSRGIPRLINGLCDAATETAERHHQERITEEIVEEAARSCADFLGLRMDGGVDVPADAEAAADPPRTRGGETRVDAGMGTGTASTPEGADTASPEDRNIEGRSSSPGTGSDVEAAPPSEEESDADSAAPSPIVDSSARNSNTNRISEGEPPVDRTESLNKVLKHLQSGSPDVEASALITEDGLMVASALPQDLDETRVAGMSATLLSLGTRAAAELRRGEVQEVIVRGETGYAVMITAGRGVLLLVVANELAKLGLIFFDMREAINAIKRIL
jgi:predicted regulator of Ras-like GTPase activity (Roadblock/LC7/MglB family)/type II secretory pathway predicted ATPase ExeA